MSIYKLYFASICDVMLERQRGPQPNAKGRNAVETERRGDRTPWRPNAKRPNAKRPNAKATERQGDIRPSATLGQVRH